LIEQYEHASINVADRRDTALTFAGPFSAIVLRPLTATFGSVRFSETLGAFQLANADGSEIVRPQEAVEGALAKLYLFQAGMTQKALRSGFSAPFNAMFIPAEYLTINCCPECYDDGGEWYCPPCLLPPPSPGPPDHLQVISDVIQTLSCPSNTVRRSITYAVVDINDTQLLDLFFAAEQFDSISANTCNNGTVTPTTCANTIAEFGGFTDKLTVNCNGVGGSCGMTLTNQRWFLCNSGGLPIGSPGTVVLQNSFVTVGGDFFFVPGTDIFP
jgi:hypothetical protein